jgi:hypothetical protein
MEESCATSGSLYLARFCLYRDPSETTIAVGTHYLYMLWDVLLPGDPFIALVRRVTKYVGQTNVLRLACPTWITRTVTFLRRRTGVAPKNIKRDLGGPIRHWRIVAARLGSVEGGGAQKPSVYLSALCRTEDRRDKRNRLLCKLNCDDIFEQRSLEKGGENG